MHSVRIARQLVRLYPRAWRARYEDEVLALVEQSGLAACDALDLVRGAAREWWLRPSPMFLESLFLTTVIWAVGSGVASWLGSHVVTPPVISFEAGQRSVLPPRLPSLLGLLGPVVLFLALLRATRGPFPKMFKRAVRPVGLAEFFVWFAAMTMGSIGMHWANLVSHLGTGLPASSWGIPGAVAWILTLNGVQFLLGARTQRPSNRSPEAAQ
jgi:hypothetical protein